MTLSPQNNRITLRLPSRLELLAVVDKAADGITEYLRFEDLDRDAVAISVIEACTNAIQHGHQDDPERVVIVEFELEPDAIIITVLDEGAGFQPVGEEDATPPDLLATRGRGIYIMRSMMDSVEFDFSRGTQVRLTKRRSTGDKSGSTATKEPGDQPA